MKPIAIFIFAIVFLSGVRALSAQEIGVVVRTEGRAGFRTSAQNERVRTLRQRMTIAAGFVIVIPDERAKAWILGFDGKVQTFSSRGEYVFESSRNVISFNDIKTLNESLYQRGLESAVGNINRDSISSVGPFSYIAPEKAVRSGDILFKWRGQSGVRVIALELREKTTMLWNHRLKQDTGELSASIPAMKPASSQDRTVTLILRYRTGDRLGSAKHQIQILSKATLSEMEGAISEALKAVTEAGPGFYIRSLIYGRYGLIEEAEMAYLRARRLNPELF